MRPRAWTPWKRKSIGVVMHLKELGVTEEMIPGLVESTLVMKGGYRVLEKEEIAEIFRRSL